MFHLRRLGLHSKNYNVILHIRNDNMTHFEIAILRRLRVLEFDDRVYSRRVTTLRLSYESTMTSMRGKCFEIARQPVGNIICMHCPGALWERGSYSTTGALAKYTFIHYII